MLIKAELEVLEGRFSMLVTITTWVAPIVFVKKKSENLEYVWISRT